MAEVSLAFQDLEAVPDIGAERAAAVRSLDLTENCIRMPLGIAQFHRLESLILDKNGLEDLTGFPPLPSLTTLSLNNNNIHDLPKIMDQISHQYPNVIYLSMMRNPVSPGLLGESEAGLEEATQRYRLYTLYRLPNVKFLDSSDVKKTEVETAQRRGQFMVTRKPIQKTPSGKLIPEQKVLPTKQENRAFLALGSKHYDGKHSEGNRFISNNDL